MPRVRSRPYLMLRLRGSGVRPNLRFDVDALAMPVVPLGVRSRARFHVLNNGFASIELNHHLPTYLPVQFEVTYPDGAWSAGRSLPHCHQPALTKSASPPVAFWS